MEVSLVSMDLGGVIAGCSFFSRVDGKSRKRLTRMALPREFKKGEVIFREGDAPPGIFIVGEGLVRIYKLAATGKEHVLHLAGPGMTFAEVAVFGGFPCPATAEAVEDTCCVLLPAEPLGRALQEDHRLSLQILSSMAMWVRSLVSLLEGIVLRDAAGRVAGYLLQISSQQGTSIALPGLKKHIASHLNLTSETLSRTLRQLRDDKVVAETPHGLVIEDVTRLQRIAEGFYPQL
ncbi:MAG TPA: Crp/Fnr family transcriptional regulator [Candidatus Methylomirabilis sp.]|nr:Crp/Fnr family transcriptional regulator [Candidatus Methylomirabilis sp.]